MPPSVPLSEACKWAYLNSYMKRMLPFGLCNYFKIGLLVNWNKKCQSCGYLSSLDEMAIIKQYLTAFSDVQSVTLTSDQSYGWPFRFCVYLSLFLIFSFRQSRFKMFLKCVTMSEPQCVNGIVVVVVVVIIIIIIITEHHHHHHWAAAATWAAASFNHYIRMRFGLCLHWNCALENVQMANRADDVDGW